MSKHHVEMTINGRRHAGDVEARISLSDFLRGDAGYTGVHVGCEHGVLRRLHGDRRRQGRAQLPHAGRASGWRGSHDRRKAWPCPTARCTRCSRRLLDEQALQCGFCTPGVVMTLAALTSDDKKPSEEELLAALSGHVCRCTGYQGIRRAARRLAGTDTGRKIMTAPEIPAPGATSASASARKEDPRLLTGRGQFVDDIALPGMLHVAFARSSIARGNILSINTGGGARSCRRTCHLHPAGPGPLQGRHDELLLRSRPSWR